MTIDFNVGIESTVEEAIRDFGRIPGEVKKQAMVRALNRAVRKVRTEAGREVRKEYYIKTSAVRKTTALKLARVQAATVEAGVRFTGARLPLTDFGARAVNPWNIPGRPHKRKGGGVSVRIKRREGRKLIEHAFLARVKSGKTLVLQRVAAGQSGSRRRRKVVRGEELESLTTLAIPQAVGSRKVFAALRRHGLATFEKEFLRQLDLLLKG